MYETDDEDFNPMSVEDELDEYGEPINNSDDEDENDDYEDNDEDFQEDEDIEDDNNQDLEDETLEDDEEQPQSPETNAYYAELRRQKKAEEAARAQFEAQRSSSPEYKMAQILAKQYGVSVDELAKQIEETALEREADEQGVSVEYLRELQAEREARKELEDRLNRIEFESWYSQKEAEKASVLEKFNGILTEQELDDAIVFALEDLQRTDISLDKAVRILYGDKIESELRRIAKQEALAEISGRKQSPLGQSGKATSTESLTSEERYIAKRMGISEEEYQKYKS